VSGQSRGQTLVFSAFTSIHLVCDTARLAQPPQDATVATGLRPGARGRLDATGNSRPDGRHSREGMSESVMLDGIAPIFSCGPPGAVRSLRNNTTLPPVACSGVLDRAPQLANEQVQLAHIETRLAIVLPSQFEKGKSILVGGNATVGRFVQINEPTLHYKHDQRRFW
jgi:hypothetical protein